MNENDMIRYSRISGKNPREMVLLKGKPCVWGRCRFCDYILDNDTDENSLNDFNAEILKNITGEYGVVEIINSGSVFEIPKGTLEIIKDIVKQKNIKRLFFESYWTYKDRLDEIRQYFDVPITFKCGIETFDNEFRNKVLTKGFTIKEPSEAAKYFDSICLLVGVEGQTKDMIAYDIECLEKYFNHACINIFVENTTGIKPDNELINWFKQNYSYLDSDPRYEVLWNNTDLGVGGVVK